MSQPDSALLSGAAYLRRVFRTVHAGREIDKGLPITAHPSYEYASITDTQFMTSRDGSLNSR
ncbi:MAG: hypothetical protein O7E52_06765 [Candidatus Poribacteria bacterium]|nr:hypothetical protein [Candidatus Poribacteria bacterium]